MQVMCANYYGLRLCSKITAPRHNWRVCLVQCQNSRYFGGEFERRKVDKSKPAW